MFPKCTKETKVLYIPGNYLQLVDKDTVNNQKELRLDSIPWPMTSVGVSVEDLTAVWGDGECCWECSAIYNCVYC